MAESDVPTTSGGQTPHGASVWLMRTDRPKRAWTCLAICVIIYAALCAFWRYLASGQWVNFAPAVFYHDLITPLGEVFRHPLDVLMYPWMILVLGLGLAMLVAVPLILAVLYRPSIAAWPVLALILLGHMPVLALAVGVGCALAGRSKFRQESPSLAMALGLLPTVGYFALSGVAGMDAVVVMPLQRWVLYAPLLIAAVAAVVVAAILLALARLTGHRTVATLPLLIALLACPAVPFYLEIGPDELSYAVVVNNLQPSGSVFDDQALKPWSRGHDAEGLSPQALAEHVREDLDARRDALLAKCRKFVRRHPNSPRKPAILWIRARAMSLQLDERALAGGLIKCSPDFLLGISTAAWKQLLESCPASNQAALAEYALAELALRDIAHGQDANTQTKLADDYLHRAEETLGKFLAEDDNGNDDEEQSSRDMFFPPPEEPNLDYYRGVLESTERLIWLINRNNVLNDPNAAEALGAYLNLNPKLPDYYHRLSQLLSDPNHQRERTTLGDNLKLAVALQTPNVYERAEMLIALAKDERTDAAIIADFELGKLAMRTAEAPAINLVKGLKTPEEYFRIVIAAPENPYQKKAAELLANIQPAEQGARENDNR